MQTQSWSDYLKGVAQNGISEAVDRFIGPDSAYGAEEPTVTPPTGDASADKKSKPVDNTPGEPQPRGILNQYTPTQLGVGALVAVAGLGLLIYAIKG